METQTVATTIPDFQYINCCIKYLASHPHKNMSYPTNYFEE